MCFLYFQSCAIFLLLNKILPSSEILKEKISKEKTKGKLILITSHILSELDDLVTHIIFMQDGKLKFHKPFEALRSETGEQKLSKVIANIMLKTAH